MLRQNKLIIIALLTTLTSYLSCTREQNYPDIGDKIAGPIDVASNGEYFYVLNADTDRTYNSGSILVMDEEGNKLSVTEVPRLGQAMEIAGNDLIIAYTESEDDKSQIQLFDLSDPLKPELKAEFEIECQPYNVALRENYKYFIVSCIGGLIYIGELAEDRAQSQLHKSRLFEISRRAIHIDPTRDVAFLFTTDFRSQDRSDQSLLDQFTYSPPPDDTNSVTWEKVEESNEIPDRFEETNRERDKTYQREVFQYVILDLAKEAADGFPYKTKYDNPEVLDELRWLYFQLYNFDGTPDIGSTALQQAITDSRRYYRTNFWAANPDPYDPNVFYLSHRGPIEQSVHANNIIKVRINPGASLFGAEGEDNPTTPEILYFQRVYGYAGEAQNWHYPGDFAVADIGGKLMLLVNHFRDLDSRGRDAEVSEFGLVARPLYEPTAITQESRIRSPESSFYQVALNNKGFAMSCLFYANAVVRFHISPYTNQFELQRIE